MSELSRELGQPIEAGLVEHNPNKLTTLLAVGTLAASLIASPSFEQPAYADTAQVVIGMPFSGQWAYNVNVNPPYTDANSSHPSVHEAYGFDWATDIYAAAGTEVDLYGRSPNGTVTFKRNSITDTCSSYGANIAGKGVVFDVRVNGNKIGEVKYDHLDLTDVGDGPISSGTKIGEVTNEALNSSCFQTRHTHVQLMNTTENFACYADHGHPGVTLDAGADLGVIGSMNNSGKQACTSIPDSGGNNNGNNSLADGTFLKINESGAIYRMVGGAPIRIYNQGALPDFNGTVTNISNDRLGQLPRYPNDTGAIMNLPEAGNAKYRFVGGAPVRIYNCGALPGNCNGAINVNFQALVTGDHMLARPHDGAVINIAEAGGAGIYEFVGGAPIRQFNWGAIPNFGPAIDVNIDALTNSDHMNAVPADGSAVSIVEAGGAGIYRFVGGAPIRLFNQGVVPDMPNVVNINSQSLAVSDHMNTRPSDRSVISIVEAGGSGIYEFAGGAPLRLYNWGPIIGSHMAVGVNFQSLANLDHMNAVPNNGEFISSQETGAVYRIAGGDPLRIYNQGGIPGYNGAVFVNQQTLDTYDHLNASPADGTILEGISSQTYWQVTGGKRVQVGAQSGAIIVDEQTIGSLPVGP